MPVRPDPQPQPVIQLRAGESLLVYLKAGTTVASIAGQLCLSPAPCWLGGQVYQGLTRIVEGEALEIEGSGWTTLTATQGSAIVNVHRVQAPWLPIDWLRKMANLFGIGQGTRTCACPSRSLRQ